ncbi:MAG: general secretion pathway protein GspK [Armatimonadetes bacterium]|nr:general secretion pathway protein GspK [Armatimonadota bacterium]
MVIVAVLGMLIVALVLSAQLGDAWVATQALQRYQLGKETNYQVARSAFELALQLLMVDDNDSDGPQDLWALGVQEMVWEGRTLQLEIRDEASRFPLRPLMEPQEEPSGPTPGEAPEPAGDESQNQRVQLEGALARLLDQAGLPGQDAVNALLDWTDPDDQSRPGGGETYATLRVKNAPLDSLAELQYLHHWELPQLPPPLPLDGGRALEAARAVDLAFSIREEKGEEREGEVLASAWSDWLTLWSEGNVNVNTAPAEILSALDERMNDAIVQEIVSVRQKQALEKEEDLQSIAGIDADLAFRLNRVVCYQSEIFRIRVVVNSTPGRVQLNAVVDRSGDKPRVLLWEVR